MKPFLSIITVNLNNYIGLKKTVQSVINQNFTDYEYIVIDGASTDRSIDIIESYRKNIDIIISELDSGIYNAMNKGVKNASGDFLLFLNSGDFFVSNTAVEDFVNHKDFKGDIIYGDYKFENGEKIYPNKLTPFFFMKSSLPHQSTFIKKSIFKDMGNYNESYSIASDREFFIKCFLSEKYQFKHINLSLTYFDLLGISNNPKHLNIKEKEDREILESNFGIYYKDYCRLLNLEKQINKFKRNTLKGLIKRIIAKIKIYAKA